TLATPRPLRPPIALRALRGPLLALGRDLAREPRLEPVERLTGAVDLIVVPRVGEPEQFGQIGGPPRRLAWQQNLAGLEHHRARLHAGDLLDPHLHKDRHAPARRA